MVAALSRIVRRILGDAPRDPKDQYVARTLFSCAVRVGSTSRRELATSASIAAMRPISVAAGIFAPAARMPSTNLPPRSWAISGMSPRRWTCAASTQISISTPVPAIVTRRRSSLQVTCDRNEPKRRWHSVTVSARRVCASSTVRPCAIDRLMSDMRVSGILDVVPVAILNVMLGRGAEAVRSGAQLLLLARAVRKPAPIEEESIVSQLAPQAQMRRLLTGYSISQAIYVAAKLGLADLLNGGPRAAADLAADVARMARRCIGCCGRSPAKVSLPKKTNGVSASRRWPNACAPTPIRSDRWPS